jgi:cell division protein FtsB
LATTDVRTILLRLVIAALLFAAITFAVQGGEWGTTDLLKARAKLARTKAGVDSLQRDVAALKARKQMIDTSAAEQERIAREEFGMVRGGKEVLYRFYGADSTPPKVEKKTP